MGTQFVRSAIILPEYWFADTRMFQIFDSDLIVSIRDVGYQHSRPDVGKAPRLNINFPDITADLLVGTQLWRAFDQELAVVIVDFVQEHIEQAQRLIVHCEAGVSRSPGVAVGLSRFFPVSSESILRDEYPLFNVKVALEIWRECERRSLSPREERQHG